MLKSFGSRTTLLPLCALVAWLLLRQILSKVRYYVKLRKSQCEEPVKYRHKDPFLGIDLFLEKKKSFEAGEFLEAQIRQFDTYGKTFQARSFGKKIITTMDPEISKAVLSTSFENFGIQPLRYEVAKNLWGNGIVVVDGPAWTHARALIRSSFEIVHIANLDRLSRHVERFMALLPRDGSTVDLLPLFQRLILDTSSEFIFGESMDALSSSTISQDFTDSFTYAQRGTGIRSMFGKFKFLHRDEKWWRACQKVTDFCDKHVEKALARRIAREGDEKSASPPKFGPERLRLVDEMAKETQDPIDLRFQIISAFSPAHDGAAIMLSNVFFHLARNPDTWMNLRAEILPTKDQPLTYELLKSYKYLDYVCRETHRLTPIVTMNQRMCLKDTVFPTGGGIDGKRPLLVQKGDVVELNYRAMMHSTAIWGEDALQFQPGRWKAARPTWEYTPFGGGPRICPGQRLVFTESAYVIVRILRDFERLENRDPVLEWQEQMRLTFQSKNGTKVALVPG